MLTLVASTLRSGPSYGADPEPPSVAAASCPDGDAVWSTVVKLVPSAAAQLLAARPNVEIADEGERYEVHVATERGPLKRVYTDPGRDCARRARFAAEFVVLALLPPQLRLDDETPAGAPGDSANRSPLPPAPIAPPPAPLPPSKDGPEHAAAPPRRASVLRIDLAGVAEASPPVLGGPAVLAWGGDVRVRIGAGRWGATLGVGYLPKVDFDAGDFRGAVTRVPALVGLTMRILDGPVHLDGDVAATAVFERYEGVSPHEPSDAMRLTPGLDVGVTLSPRALAGLAPLVGLSCAWLPWTQELVAAPQGNVATTPSLWFGATLGVSLEL